MTAFELRTTLESAVEIMEQFRAAYDSADNYAGKVEWAAFPLSMELNEFREYNLWYDGDEYSLDEVDTWKDLAEVLKTIGLIDDEDIALAEAVIL